MQKKQVARIDRLESYFFHPEYACFVGGTGRISGEYTGWQAYQDGIILGETATPGQVNNIEVKLAPHHQTKKPAVRNNKPLAFALLFS